MDKLYNGFTQLPNVLWDRTDLNIYDRAVMTHIIRKTIGWGKNIDGISLSQFVGDLGISKNTAIKSIKKLCDIHVITVEKQLSQSGCCGFNLYSISEKMVDLVNNSTAKISGGVVHEVNRGSSPGEQGVVHEVNRGSSPGEQTKETITKHTRTKEKEVKRKNDDDVRAKQKVLINKNWRPSDRCLALINKAGISLDFAESMIDEFILYWEERRQKRPGWDATFLNKVKSQYEYQQKNNKSGFVKNIKNHNGGGNEYRAKENKSFFDRYGHIDGINP